MLVQNTHVSLRQIKCWSYCSKVSRKTEFAWKACNMHGPFAEKKEGLLWVFKLCSRLSPQAIRTAAAKCQCFPWMHVGTLVYFYIFIHKLCIPYIYMYLNTHNMKWLMYDYLAALVGALHTWAPWASSTHSLLALTKSSCKAWKWHSCHLSRKTGSYIPSSHINLLTAPYSDLKGFLFHHWARQFKLSLKYTEEFKQEGCVCR